MKKYYYESFYWNPEDEILSKFIDDLELSSYPEIINIYKDGDLYLIILKVPLG